MNFLHNHTSTPLLQLKTSKVFHSKQLFLHRTCSDSMVMGNSMRLDREWKSDNLMNSDTITTILDRRDIWQCKKEVIIFILFKEKFYPLFINHSPNILYAT